MDTIQTTLGKLAAAERGLVAVGELDLRGKVLYHAAKLARLAGAELAIFHDKKLGLIKKLGEQQGDRVTVKPEHVDEWKSSFDALAAVEVSLAWAPLKRSDLGDVALKASDYNALIDAGLMLEDEAKG